MLQDNRRKHQKMSRLIKHIIKKALADEKTSFNIIYIPKDPFFDTELIQNTNHHFFFIEPNLFADENVSTINLDQVSSNMSIDFDLIINNDPLNSQKIQVVSKMINSFRVPCMFVHHDDPSDVKRENKMMALKELSNYKNFVISEQVQDSLMLYEAEILTENFNKHILDTINNHEL